MPTQSCSSSPFTAAVRYVAPFSRDGIIGLVVTSSSRPRAWWWFNLESTAPLQGIGCAVDAVPTRSLKIRRKVHAYALAGVRRHFPSAVPLERKSRGVGLARRKMHVFSEEKDKYLHFKRQVCESRWHPEEGVTRTYPTCDLCIFRYCNQVTWTLTVSSTHPVAWVFSCQVSQEGSSGKGVQAFDSLPPILPSGTQDLFVLHIQKHPVVALLPGLSNVNKVLLLQLRGGAQREIKLFLGKLLWSNFAGTYLHPVEQRYHVAALTSAFKLLLSSCLFTQHFSVWKAAWKSNLNGLIYYGSNLRAVSGSRFCPLKYSCIWLPHRLQREKFPLQTDEMNVCVAHTLLSRVECHSFAGHRRSG